MEAADKVHMYASDARGTNAVVEARGSLDHHAACHLASQIDKALAKQPARLIVDLTHAEALGSPALNSLLRLVTRRDESCKCAVVCGPGPVQQLLELSGLTWLLAVYPDHESCDAASRDTSSGAPSGGYSAYTG